MTDENTAPEAASPQPAQPAPAQPASSGQGMAIAALALGIVALLLSFLPWGIGFVAMLLGVPALILGIIVLAKKKPGKGKALTGLILGAAAAVVAVVATVSSIALTSWLFSDTETPETSETSESTEPTPEPTEAAEIPEGFTDFGTGLAYMFTGEGCSLYERCSVVEVYAYADCPDGVEIFANELDDAGVIQQETYADAGVMKIGDISKVELEVTHPNATNVEITDMICYTY